MRYYYLRLILLPESPHRIALGLAIGIFVALTPTVGVQMAAAVVLALILRGSKVAAAIGCWLTNPVTMPVFYTAFFLIGRTVTHFGHGTRVPAGGHIGELLAASVDKFLAMLVGGLIMGAFVAPLVYFLTRKYVRRLQAWERAKLRKKQ